MKTYLVTGGAGFIGSHLVEKLLSEGNKVINVDNFNNYYDVNIKINNVIESVGIQKNENLTLTNLKNEVESNVNNYILEIVDIRDINEMTRIFEENKIDAVAHLAAAAGVRPSIQDPLLYEEVNVRGTMNVLELMKKNDIKKFVCASSSSVYGNNEKVPFSEEDNVDRTISPYAATKKTCEIIAHTYFYLYNIDTVMLRFFTVYGPRQRPDLAIHKFTKMISRGEKIPFYGDGTTQRDYTYIEDIIDGVIKSIKYVEENKNVYEIINLGESETISLKKMVETIEKELKIKAILDIQPMQAGDVNRTYANVSKAKEILKYKPETKFGDGIKKFISWYNNKKN